MAGPPIDLDWEEYALRCEAQLVAGWTLAGVPADEIDAYLQDTGYGKRLAAYKAARAAG
jgi:hypothetical protein